MSDIRPKLNTRNYPMESLYSVPRKYVVFNQFIAPQTARDRSCECEGLYCWSFVQYTTG